MDAPAAGTGPALLHITVVYSPAPRQVEVRTLGLPPGSTVADAVRASGLAALHPPQDAVLARWGRKVEATAPLAEGDRIEWLRPLVVDPKESRRLRYRAQGVRGRTRSKTAPGR